MAYKANHSDLANYGSITVEDKSINNDTSLALLGRLYPGYSKYVAENFLHLLENFASFQPPVNPVIGQLWWDTDTNNITPEPKLMVWNGSNWATASAITKSITAPSALIGDLWVDTTSNTLKMFTGITNTNSDGWTEFSTDFDPSSGTGISTESLSNHEAVTVFVNGNPIAVFSSTIPEYPYAGLDGFDVIKPGLNISSNYTISGTIDNALNLKSGNNIYSANDFFKLNATNNSTGNIVLTNANGIEIKSVTDPNNKQIKIYPDVNNVAITSKSDIKVVARSATGSPLNLFLSDTGATLNKKLTISNDLEANNVTSDSLLSTLADIGTLNVGLTNASSNIIPTPANNNGTVGSESLRWSKIWAVTVDAATIGIPGTLLQGNLEGTVFGKDVINVDAIFKATGDITGSETLYNIGTGIVNIGTTIAPSAITTKPEQTNWNGSGRFLVEDTGVLKSVKMENVVTAIGAVMPIARNPALLTPPKGYLPCNGAEVSVADYPALYAAIDETFGSANSGVTFTLPSISDLSPDIKYYIFTGNWE